MTIIIAPKQAVDKALGSPSSNTTAASHFRFTDLPPELRNSIYRLALVADNSIEIRRRRRAKKGQPPYWLEAKTLRMNGKQMRKPALHESNGTAVLRLSWQCNLEATAILYAENHFIFKKKTAFVHFRSQVRANSTFLESFEIRDCNQYAETSLFDAFVGFPKLRFLKLCFPRGVCYKPYAKGRLFGLIRPLLMKAQTPGCSCGAKIPWPCICRTTEQQRYWDALHFSVTAAISPADLKLLTKETWAELLQWEEKVKRRIERRLARARAELSPSDSDGTAKLTAS
ncbi:hypothetical protein BAUCODRAFT_465327 [Baudoinia panamericana UAMH 10762]|uniref:DUF7730 domain-containing protein n=1 Tax=Baudoinia panamericana (strain UAMH 10762) TaxID=717646 RepID=M2NAL5_BAUPA|nr:uncharacterized protein BAUCODRAFT_465327 [Baudoinia panamericana UAMH 10762]EMC96179.1 hypothetical protein BAUCODRAFT_465327 [Baudoinia panamericana UAMH 10762]